MPPPTRRSVSPSARSSSTDPDEALQQTPVQQPAILLTSIAYLRALRNRGLLPDADFVAGHSLGEYAAMVAAGSLDFEDALRLVRRRGELMQEHGAGAMAAILGLAAEDVAAVARDAGAEVANFNAPDQTTVSGRADAVERAIALAKERGAKRAVLLPVSGAFHSSLMAPVAEAMRPLIDGTAVQRWRGCPWWPNVDARFLRRSCRPRGMSWSIRSAARCAGSTWWPRSSRAGVTTFYEIGPGKVLAGLIGRCAPEATVFTAERCWLVALVTPVRMREPIGAADEASISVELRATEPRRFTSFSMTTFRGSWSGGRSEEGRHGRGMDAERLGWPSSPAARGVSGWPSPSGSWPTATTCCSPTRAMPRRRRRRRASCPVAIVRWKSSPPISRPPRARARPSRRRCSNSAGSTCWSTTRASPATRLLMRMNDEDWDDVLTTNLKGAFLTSKAAIRPMLRQRSGRIVNISSVVGQVGNAGQANYAAAKAGLIGFTKSLAKEVGSRGITVNAIAPGFIDTRMTAGLPDEMKATILERTPPRVSMYRRRACAPWRGHTGRWAPRSTPTRAPSRRCR